MKNYRENIIDKVQNFLDQNVGDYSYFKASEWYKNIKEHFEYMEWAEEELGWIWSYLMKVEEESHIESELW